MKDTNAHTNAHTSTYLSLILLLIPTIYIITCTCKHKENKKETRDMKHVKTMKIEIDKPFITLVNKKAIMNHLIYSIAMVESESPYKSFYSVGEAGEIGPLQIMEDYWKDSKVPGRWENCVDWDYSVKATKAYWARWCSEAFSTVDCETLARIHRGGPRGMKKESTVKYWLKVKKQMSK